MAYLWCLAPEATSVFWNLNPGFTRTCSKSHLGFRGLSWFSFASTENKILDANLPSTASHVSAKLWAQHFSVSGSSPQIRGSTPAGGLHVSVPCRYCHDWEGDPLFGALIFGHKHFVRLSNIHRTWLASLMAKNTLI